jgi:UDPglucose 6-dehydrogenase
VAIWGLAFKPNTDDMREAPAIPLIEALLDAGATVSAFDPAAGEAARALFGDRIRVASTDHEALEGADCLAVITEWNAFRMPDFERVREQLSAPLLFDGRNIYSPEKMVELDFTYYCIGRSPVVSESARPWSNQDASGRI